MFFKCMLSAAPLLRLEYKKCIPALRYINSIQNYSQFRRFHEPNLNFSTNKKYLILRLSQNGSPNILRSDHSPGILRGHNFFTSSFCTSNQLLHDKNIIDENLKRICLKYPNPKNVLNTYYTIVSNELKVNHQIVSQYKIAPHRKGDKNREWMCTYSVKWPEEIKVSEAAFSKAEASRRAANKLLYLLEKSGKILDNGQPVVYDKDTFNKITKRTYVPIELSHNVENKLRQICDIYQNNLRKNIENKLDKNKALSADSNPNVQLEDEVFKTCTLHHQRNKSLNTYYAKESVQLPIQAHRQELEKLLDDHRVIIIRGETGCGKSTRIPQYVLEHWVRNEGLEPVKILVTQPRRIAAISLAERVASERQERVGDIVGYQVRLRSKFNSQSGRILYCTTGILLRQLQSDPRLENCTHVLVDEAHERDVNTDLLVNLLRHALELNPKLKVMVMSATMDTSLFQGYFDGAPVMNIPGFTYPVKMNFLEDIKVDLSRTRDMSQNANPSVVVEDVARVLRWIHRSKPEGAVLCFLPGWDEISRVRKSLERSMGPHHGASMVLALHSKLTDDDQRRIFGHAPPGVRKIILATNIAETSVTVDDVVYVVDAGVHKEARLDAERGDVCVGQHWISKASVRQRKGRAGRVMPGESFHLFPKSRFQSMDTYSIPEILRVSLTKIVLDAKVYSHDMNAIEFFSNLPCPPEDGTVLKAIDELRELELLDENEQVTPLGKILSEFQLPPKLSRAMVQSVIYKCVTPIVDIATIFSSESEMFSSVLTDKQGIKETKQSISQTSDHISLMILLERWLNYMNDEEYQEASEFCAKNNLVSYKLSTLRKLQDIHFEYLEKYLKGMELCDDFADSEEMIKGILLSGVGNVLMHRDWDIVKGRLKSANVYITRNGQKATITPESVNNKKKDNERRFFVYINEMRSIIRRTTLIRETSLINPLTLLLFYNRKLYFKNTPNKENNNDENRLVLRFEGTKLEFLCSERQAILIDMCKTAMKNMECYFIKQLTDGEELNVAVLENWDQILNILNEILRSDET